ncbi:U3 small nucleolar RNA-associated protein [Coemansia sp. RSA 2706]|nr:U3 small nucleolar RNA-associated protein [Coemansia sp. RSA 2711]KAJ2299488.1 U3 small nucleolar RNA-associated protein [Coemansia sp. RSA 2706]KAJ2316131.1 U3 small nucleolar RNA-associated protein [Coemansia sp. RSA 2704]KAJ2323241.1 U3 small nucleolar RNA-associated protein 15 [Coemansia sp. RSA 2702]KAJ2369445.1 U3 small nucleolar RNA-associated protein [Coemansia sp. RSA 2610]KAJ2718795.1 U3 small nucleolar RNA-associated protein 15 [Coemansia sp. Cherry 401B]
MDYQPVGAGKTARSARRTLPEAAYWKKFQSPVLVKEYGMVTSLEFSPLKPHDLLVTAAMRLQVYNGRTSQLKKSITRFAAQARSGSFRPDGKLIVAGDDSNLVQVFDGASRAVLRTFRGHRDPVHVTKFLPNNVHVLSASDDKTVQIWDIPSQAAVNVFDDHTDYVRSGCAFAGNANLVATGSYDHTVRIWDVRANRSVTTISTDDPVEDVVALAGGGVVAAAAGPNVHMFDLLMGGRTLTTLGNHEKTVTSLCLDSAGGRLLAGSLDHHVKIYNVQSFKMMFNMGYPAPVLSLALSADDTRLAVGMASGVFSLRRRAVSAKEQAAAAPERRLRAGTHAYFTRGSTYRGADDDVRVEQRRKRNLADYDQYLRKFEHSRALDAVLANNRTGLTVVALLQELVHRDGLVAALAGRDELSLDPIVRFVIKFVDHPRYAPVLIQVAEVLLDIYGDLLHQSARLAELLVRLRSKVRTELRVQQDLSMLLGSMDMLMAACKIGVSYQK